jgi:hypothetical protein
VREGRLGVLFDQRARRDEMRRHLLGVPRVEAPQRTAHRGVEVARIHPLGQLRRRRERRTAVLGRPLVTRAGPLGATALRTTLLPGTPIAARPLRPIPLRTPLLPGTALTRLALRTVVMPLGAVTGRTVALRATVLPLRPITRGTVTLRTTLLPGATLAGRTLRTVPVRATVLPLRPITARPLRAIACHASGTPRARRPATEAHALGPGPVVTRRNILVTVAARALLVTRVGTRSALTSGATRSAGSSAGTGTSTTGPSRAASLAGAAVAARSIGTASRGSHDCWVPLRLTAHFRLQSLEVDDSWNRTYANGSQSQWL